MAFVDAFLSNKDYDEIYINVGKSMMPLIEGLEKTVKCKVTFAAGRGLGMKAHHMKQWLQRK